MSATQKQGEHGTPGAVSFTAKVKEGRERERAVGRADDP